MSENTEDLIVRLLRNLGSKKEVDQYLRLFSSVESRRFAVIKVSGGVVRDELEDLASSIAFLERVGLVPVVLHGAGPQLLDALKEAGISAVNDEGERRITERGIEIARKVYQRENLRIVDALEALDVDARPVPTGVFEAELLDRKKRGFVGRVTRVHPELIDSSVRGDQIPVIASLAETPTGQTVNVNADEACRALSLALQPFKVVFLSPQDGLRDEHGEILSAVNLEEDFEALQAAAWLTDGMKKKLVEAKAMLDELPRSSSVVVASPENLARELFTHKGAGTLIRKGERVRRFDSLDGIDKDRLRALLEDSFGKKLFVDYFDKKKFWRVYLADSYRATAILTREALPTGGRLSGGGPASGFAGAGEGLATAPPERGVPYLDKFAVTKDAQGDGIGASLWQHLAAENPKLFWRARADNEVNPWYFARADGSFKQGAWIVFWIGLDFAEIERCVACALEMPASLKSGAA